MTRPTTEQLVAILENSALDYIGGDDREYMADRLNALQKERDEFAAKLLEIHVHLENSNKALENGVALIERLQRVAVAARRFLKEGDTVDACGNLTDALKQLDDGS